MRDKEDPSMPLSRTVCRAIARVVLLTAAFGGATGTAYAQAHFEGATGPGSRFEIDVPANWNGDLVLYAHGIVQASSPVALPTTADGYAILRSHALDAGFAVAPPSYSTNGWALAYAVRRTHQLSGSVTSKIGRPRR